jgi:hypothetical protein
VSPAETLRVHGCRMRPRRCPLMYVTSICHGWRNWVPRSSSRGARPQDRGVGLSDRGARPTELGAKTAGSVHPDPLIALYCRRNCLPVPAVLVVRGICAGQRLIGERALLPQQEPRRSPNGPRHPCTCARPDGVLSSSPPLNGSCGERTDLTPRPSPVPVRSHSQDYPHCRCSSHGTSAHPYPPLPGAHGLCHDETDSRREVAGQRGPGAGEGPWYHAAQPLPGMRRRLAVS